MTKDPTTAYFNDVIARAATARAVPRQVWAEAEPNKCHQNCEKYVAQFMGFEVVRGWLVLNECFCIPHSVIRNKATGSFADITPEPSRSQIPFVEHLGIESDFQSLRQGRDGGWMHPPVQVSSGSCGEQRAHENKAAELAKGAS